MGRSSYPWGTVRGEAPRREVLLDFLLLAAAEDGPRPFPEPVVEALRRVVPSETVAYREWGRDGILDRAFAPGDLPTSWSEAWLEYPRLRRDDPHPSELMGATPERVGKPLVLGDAVGGRWFRTSGLYFELMRPFGIRNVLKLFLPRQRAGGVESVFVFDSSARAFANEERMLLARLVPALVALRQNARLRAAARRAERRLQLLTPRELTVLGRVSDGETNAQIAAALFIGTPTVRKHLEHVYDKLGVGNRAAAAAVYTAGSGGSA